MCHAARSSYTEREAFFARLVLSEDYLHLHLLFNLKGERGEQENFKKIRGLQSLQVFHSGVFNCIADA
jgi:hypothetical protein